jgi:hypothetical protein
VTSRVVKTLVSLISVFGKASWQDLQVLSSSAAGHVDMLIRELERNADLLRHEDGAIVGYNIPAEHKHRIMRLTKYGDPVLDHDIMVKLVTDEPEIFSFIESPDDVPALMAAISDDAAKGYLSEHPAITALLERGYYLSEGYCILCIWK